MRITAISDTHSLHKKFERLHVIPDADLLIHSGDMSNVGRIPEIIDFNAWLGTIKHKFKFGIVLIAGNHDWLYQTDPGLAKSLITNATLLMDESVVINGLNFYGSSWQPEFCGWAFNLPRGEQLAQKWAQIPDDTNVLITHGPPHGIMDGCERIMHMPDGTVIEDVEHVGCEDLSARIKNLKQLKLNVFGHIHAGYGTEMHNGVQYVNACSCNETYFPENPPITIAI
jgi:Icc-related predicted phosphoesterase